jgi:hypothetical protein
MHVFLKILLHITFFCMGDGRLHKHKIRSVLSSTCLSHSSFYPRFLYEHSILIFLLLVIL